MFSIFNNRITHKKHESDIHISEDYTLEKHSITDEFVILKKDKTHDSHQTNGYNKQADLFLFLTFLDWIGHTNGRNYVIWFVKNLRMTDVERVGGKNASLGEMISQLTEKGVRVPGGFATTAEAYRAFLAHNGLSERISEA